jgi:hypothetical protein
VENLEIFEAMGHLRQWKTSKIFHLLGRLRQWKTLKNLFQ